MRSRAIIFMLLLASAALAQTPARVPVREGWRLMDGVWVRPQAVAPISELVRLELSHGVHRIVAQPSARIEPMLRGNRVVAVEIQGSPFVWKLSAQNRQWEDNRSRASQQLQLFASPDGRFVDEKLRLVRLEVTPNLVSIEAWVKEDDLVIAVYLVLGESFAELATAVQSGEGNAARDFVVRASTAHELLREHPVQARQYLRPMMRLISNDPYLLQAGAGDVYRVFDDLPVDELIAQTVRKIVPDLGAREARVRERASIELHSLGRRGVQAALRLDREKLPPEPADRIATFIDAHSPDPRPRDKLLADPAFLADCLQDPDPNVRAAASRALATPGQ